MRAASIIVALALAATAGAEGAPHPVYARLKAYRSYFQVNQVEPMAHRFTAWFVARGYCRSDLGGNTPEDFAAVPDGELGISTGAFAIPPGAVEPAPEEVAHLAAAFEARLREAYPEAVDMKVAYKGELRVLRVEEVTPLTLGGEAGDRFGRRSTLTLAHGPGSSQLEDCGAFQAYGGLGGLVPYGQEAELPRFVPFVMPAAIEGSALG